MYRSCCRSAALVLCVCVGCICKRKPHSIDTEARACNKTLLQLSHQCLQGECTLSRHFMHQTLRQVRLTMLRLGLLSTCLALEFVLPFA
mmetsp:Transcript_24137/g.61058  ORF Transcript_24137/g.61058 Transcript_24137/m.61058 type:complete len:89 (+) Transcript_24137:314-580(+)